MYGVVVFWLFFFSYLWKETLKKNKIKVRTTIPLCSSGSCLKIECFKVIKAFKIHTCYLLHIP